MDLRQIDLGIRLYRSMQLIASKIYNGGGFLNDKVATLDRILNAIQPYKRYLVTWLIDVL